MHRRIEALLVVSLPAALALLAGPPTLAVGTTGDPFASLVSVVALLAWACTAWLLLALGVTWGAALRGRPGQVLAAASRLVAPSAVRAVLRVALGVTVGASALAASPAQAAEPPAPVYDLDWPTALRASSAAAPQPVRVQAEPPAPSAPTPVAQVSSVLVRSGDTLWGIARRSLGPAATPVRVSQTWPRWWAANREAIGADPDLIHPGVLLEPPTRGEP